MQFRKIVSVPETPPPELTDEEREAYWNVINPDGIIHKLLGQPNRIQQPVTRGARIRPHLAMLLQLNSDRRLDMQ